MSESPEAVSVNPQVRPVPGSSAVDGSLDQSTAHEHEVPTGPWAGTVTVAVISALFGTWTLTGTALTYLPALLVPSALGLPFGVPPLRLTPLGETTTGSWAVDVIAALVMIAVVWMRLVSSSRLHPAGGVARAFWAGLGATVIGVVAGNLVRIVYLSFVLHEGPGAYLASLVGGALVSVLWGAVVGVAVGVAHAIARQVTVRLASRHRSEPDVVTVGAAMREPQQPQRL